VADPPARARRGARAFPAFAAPLLPPSSIALLLFPFLLFSLALAGCSSSGDGGLTVRLVYPQEGGTPARPAYLKDPSNRILIRVLAPHLPAPVEAWFDRSTGHGEIAGIPPGDRIAVEVDEYDNTAATLGTNAPLLGRGFTRGIALSAGERKTVTVAMYDKGTILRLCGALPNSGAGTAGDTGDGGLADNALLGNPLAVKVGQDDAVYVSSSQYNRIRRIDRYGYISHYAGSGPSGTISDGQAAATAPIGPVYDLDVGPTGDLYFITVDQQIGRIEGATGLLRIRYNAQKGNFNPAAKPDLAVASDDAIYYTNGMENRVYLVSGGARSDYVSDNTPSQTGEGADKNFYPLRYPASVTFVPSDSNIFFTDRDNNRIKLVSLSAGRVYTKAGGGSVATFSEGMDPLSMILAYPVLIEGDFAFGNFFFRERDFHGIRILRHTNKVYSLAGTGFTGYSGDGGPATAALLNTPSAVAVDSRGNVYIADTGNHALRMVLGGALP
jgi:hypothetical protein